MAITREEVLKTAALAHVQLTPDEVDLFTEQLSGIIEYVDQLKELDTSDVPPMSHSTLGEHAERSWRDDAVRPSLGGEEATAGAPEPQLGYFKVPSVIRRASGDSDPAA
jgi:aspartyl-tRNA(Asn)/glutamyl-tRNA(Gln) amidotransferase subunit C